MSINLFRTCPESGLQFHKPSEWLMRAHAVFAVVILLFGGITALLVTLTRWPAVHLLPADLFYQMLTAHGVNMLIFWIITFEIAVLYFCSSTLLRCRLATPRIAWLGFALMLIGVVVNNLAVANGDASVMMTSYVPMPANPNFYLGLIIFAVGALLGCFVFLGTLVIAKEEKTYEGSIPLVTFGALTACIIAVFTIASGAIILIPTYLWSIGYISHIDAVMYRLDLVCDCGDRIRCKTAVGKGQSNGIFPVHRIPATRECTPFAGRSRNQFGMEDIQHQLCHVPGRPCQHGSRTNGTGLYRGRAARQRLYQGAV